MKREIEIISSISIICGIVLLVVGYASKSWHHSLIGLILYSPLTLYLLWPYRTKIVQWILENRTYSLVEASLLGAGFAFAAYYFFCGLGNDILHSSLTILSLGLPTFFILWLFRTEDVQKQIDKTEENTNNSTFFECARMLVEATRQGGETKSLSTKTALEQLAYLKRKTSFNKERVYILTQGFNLRNLDLSCADLSGADLSIADLRSVDLHGADLNDANLGGANLGRANLSSADLRGADLRNANLSSADLSGADLSVAKLSGANLRSANLRSANLVGANLGGANLRGANLSGATLKNFIANYTTKWKGAIYSAKTKFNGTRLESEASCEKEGMIYKSDEQT